MDLKDKLNFSSYNSGSQTVTGEELEKTVKKILPDAKIDFDEKNLRNYSRLLRQKPLESFQ